VTGINLPQSSPLHVATSREATNTRRKVSTGSSTHRTADHSLDAMKCIAANATIAQSIIAPKKMLDVIATI
jgi:hypothetical protein